MEIIIIGVCAWLAFVSLVVWIVGGACRVGGAANDR